MVENLLKVIHILEDLQQAEQLGMLNMCALQSTKISPDHVRTRSWSEDSKNYCIQDFDVGSRHETCCGKICSMPSATRVEERCAAVDN